MKLPSFEAPQEHAAEQPQPEDIQTKGEQQPVSEEAQNTVEQEKSITLEQLPESLGFVETLEMIKCKELWIQAQKDENLIDAKGYNTQYVDLASKLVEEKGANDSEPYRRAQTGSIIAIALIQRDYDKFIEGMNEAWQDSARKGFSFAAKDIEGCKEVF